MIELLVVGVLVGIVMFSLMRMFNGLARTQKSIVQSVDFDNLVMLVQMALQNPSTCPSALRTTSGAPLQLPSSLTLLSPNLPAGGIPIGKISIGALLVDTALPFQGLYIQSIRLRQVTAGSPSPASLSPYQAVLRIVGSKSAPGKVRALGGGALARDIPISLTIQKPNAGNATLLSCETKATLGSGSSGPNLSSCVTVYVPFIDDEVPRVQMCPNEHPYYSGVWLSQESAGKDSDRITQIECCS
jgi:hypothetical protein